MICLNKINIVRQREGEDSPWYYYIVGDEDLERYPELYVWCDDHEIIHKGYVLIDTKVITDFVSQSIEYNQ